jgi:hypothetical protein
MRALMLLVLAPACVPGPGSQCADQTGPGTTGMARYTTGDGVILEDTLGPGFMRMTDADAVSLTGELTDEWGRPRRYRLELHDLGPGAFDLAGHGSLCMPRQTGGDDVCSGVAGPIDVRRLDSECYTHQSGISTCIFTIDLTLEVTSVWQATTFELDAVQLTEGAWVECEE